MFTKGINLQSEKITHGFFGRRGGVSAGLYESLNCGLGTNDPAENVQQNRMLVCNAIGAGSLVGLYQVHGAECVYANEPWSEEDRPHADAMVTDVPDIALGIVTADCAPVLFFGEKDNGEPVVGAAHAGWGGALKGVLESTLDQMASLGAKIEGISAAIGPCIEQTSYEVSDEFMAPFLEHDLASSRFFTSAKKEGHRMFDLPGYIAGRLMHAGIADISKSETDTYFNEMDYFSYRRSTHRQEPDYGRQIAVIAIKG